MCLTQINMYEFKNMGTMCLTMGKRESMLSYLRANRVLLAHWKWNYATSLNSEACEMEDVLVSHAK